MFVQTSYDPAKVCKIHLPFLNFKILFTSVKALSLHQNKCHYDYSSVEWILRKMAKKRLEQLLVKTHKNVLEFCIASCIRVNLEASAKC